MQEEQLLNTIIKNKAQQVIDTSNHIPHIYTAIVDSVSGTNVTVHFAQDVNTKMTFPNKSNATPSAGQGVYILTTGGSNLTGAFIIAVTG